MKDIIFLHHIFLKIIFYKYKKDCVYVILEYIMGNQLLTNYYMRNFIWIYFTKEWNIKRNYLIIFLKRSGYSDSVLIDEYQAYRYSEAFI